MNRTTIEWVKNPDGTQGYTWNPVTGCMNHINGICKGGKFSCYAFKLARGRLKSRYLANHQWTPIPMPHTIPALLDPFYPRFWEDRMRCLVPRYAGSRHLNKPRGIFVCDMSDLFGIGIPEGWTSKVLSAIRLWPEHRFYLLTKQPQNLLPWSPFPENCWVGVTITNGNDDNTPLAYFKKIEAKVKFISFEPLLKWWDRISMAEDEYAIEKLAESFRILSISWIIIGSCTGRNYEIDELAKKYPELTPMPWDGKWTLQPKIEWVKEIVEACDKAGVKVFLKNNLKPLVGYIPRQELL